MERFGCPFCYVSGGKEVDEGEGEREEANLAKWHTFLQRYFGENQSSVSLEEFTVTWPENGVKCCGDCGRLFEEICREYHQVRIAELRLRWRLECLGNVVRLADKVPERRVEFRRTMEGVAGHVEQWLSTEREKRKERIYERVKLFREDILNKCYQSFATGIPRVVLDKRKVDEGRKLLKLANAVEQVTNQEVDLSKSLLVTSIPLDCNSATASNQFEEESVTRELTSSRCSKTEADAEESPQKAEMGAKNKVQVHLYLTPDDLDNNEPSSPVSCGSFSHDNVLESHHEDEGLPVTESLDVANENDFGTCRDETTVTVVKLEAMAPLDREQEPEESVIQKVETPISDCVPLPQRKRRKRRAVGRQYNLRKSAKQIKYADISDDDEGKDPSYELELENKTVSNDVNKSSDESQSTATCLQCKYCRNRTFIDKGRLKMHFKFIHPTKVLAYQTVNNTSTLKCPECQKLVCNRSTLYHHMKSKHPDWVKTRQESKIPGEFRCHLCPKQFRHKNYLGTHLCSVHGVRKRFRRKKVKPEFSCDEGTCTRRCLNEAELHYHKRLHGQFSCQFCDKVETFVPDLCRHELEHSTRETGKTEEGIFCCPRCSYRIKGRQKLYTQHYMQAHLQIAWKDMWECPICKVKLQSIKQERHFARHHDLNGVDPEIVVRCKAKDCSAYFLRYSQWRKHNDEFHQRVVESKPATEIPPEKHADEETPVKLYDCKQCFRQFKLKSWLEQHEKRRHVLPRIYPSKHKKCGKRTYLYCSVAGCSEKFRNEESLTGHKKLHGSWKCGVCKKEFNFGPDLAIHEAGHTTNTSTDKKPSSSKNSKNEIIRFSCPRCKQFCPSKRVYTCHFVEKHLELSMKNYTCKICGSSHRDSLLGERHFIIHHFTEGVNPEDIYHCDQCPAYFIVGTQLISHKRKAHKNPNPYLKCDICGTTYKNERTLETHNQNYHPKEVDPASLTEVCEVPHCGMRFASKADLQWHTTYQHIKREKHSGWNDCKFCGKSIWGENGMRTHVRVRHTNVKKKPEVKHQCDQCGKEYKNKQILQMHMLWHQDPSTWDFKCEVCSKMCVNRDKLKEHMRTHQDVKPYQCELCGLEYAHRHNWRLHMKNKHDVEVPRAFRKGKGALVQERLAAKK